MESKKISNTDMVKVFRKYVRRDGNRVTIGIPGEEPLFSHEAGDMTNAKAFEADAWWFLENVAREILALQSATYRGKLLP